MSMVWRTIVFILLIFLFVIAVRRPQRSVEMAESVATSTAQTAAPLIAIAAIEGAFYEIGTLVFYPNNVAPVPYIIYTDKNGDIAAKALIFDNLPPTDFSLWTGARIAVTGVIDREHVVVQQIDYLAPP